MKTPTLSTKSSKIKESSGNRGSISKTEVRIYINF
jgi:hypothetical protein